MAGSSPWPTIQGEREALLHDLEPLDDAAWRTPSLCEQWTVQDVLAHMSAAAHMGSGAFFAKLIGSGFSFEKVQAKGVAEQSQGTPADLLNRFREAVPSTTHPPGPVDTWLGETIVHSEDIRRPLGIAHSYPEDALVRAADFFKGSNLIIGSKKRISGLTLRATDTDWSSGDGPEVTGPMLSLVMAMTGRKGVVDDLEGEGVEALRARD
jgi:uncharacterized protein (TIGR03083 family)